MLFRKRQPRIRYDPSTQVPAIRKSICTGEMTAGFVDKRTGAFQELMKIDSVEAFKRQVGTDDVRIIY